MKIICTQENLNRALNVVGKVVNKNITLPILNNILLKTDKNGLKLSSTNLEIGVNYWIGGKVEKEGEITVPTKLFANFVASLPQGNVEIKTKDDMVGVKCENYKINIKGIDAKEYPISPEIDSKFLFKLKSADFKEAVLQVLPSVSLSESRMEITGILLDFSEMDKNKITLVATDSYRLARKDLKISKENINTESLKVLGNVNSVIIPKNAMQELSRDLGEGDETLEIIIAENQVVFSFGRAVIISRLIEGSYPQYKQVIPEKFLSQVVMSIKDVSNAVKIAGFFSSTSNNSVKFKIGSDSKVEISSEATELGSNNSKISARVSGKELEVIYNYKYLLDGLGSLEGGEIVLNANDENAPSVLKAGEDETFLYVLMPIRS